MKPSFCTLERKLSLFTFATLVNTLMLFGIILVFMGIFYENVAASQMNARYVLQYLCFKLAYTVLI